MTGCKVIRLGMRSGMSQRAAVEACMAQYVSREEYPELFGDEPKFDFEVEDNSERVEMTREEFEEKLEEYKERVAKEKGVSVERQEAFEITEE